MNRVKQLMKEINLDINNENLVLSMCYIYSSGKVDVLSQVGDEFNKIYNPCNCGNPKMEESDFCEECV